MLYLPLLARVCWIRAVIVWTVRGLRRLRMPAFVRILVVVLGLLAETLFGVKTIISPLSVVYVGSTCDMREQSEELSVVLSCMCVCTHCACLFSYLYSSLYRSRLSVTVSL